MKKTTILRFSPYVWAKLLYMRDHGSTEIAGFGIASKERPLYLEDFRLVKQKSTGCTFDMTEEGLVEFYTEMSRQGKEIIEYGRVMIHTHPGNGVIPSGTDEKNFDDMCGPCVDWMAMVIVGKEGAVYTRLRYGAGPGSDVEITHCLDYTRSQAWDDTIRAAWKEEYDRCLVKLFEDRGSFQGGRWVGGWEEKNGVLVPKEVTPSGSRFPYTERQTSFESYQAQVARDRNVALSAGGNPASQQAATSSLASATENRGTGTGDSRTERPALKLAKEDPDDRDPFLAAIDARDQEEFAKVPRTTRFPRKVVLTENEWSEVSQDNFWPPVEFEDRSCDPIVVNGFCWDGEAKGWYRLNLTKQVEETADADLDETITEIYWDLAANDDEANEDPKDVAPPGSTDSSRVDDFEDPSDPDTWGEDKWKAYRDDLVASEIGNRASPSGQSDLR